MNPPRFKGAPFNLRTIRWHRTKQGFAWQYWNAKVARWCRYTKRPITEDEARVAIALYCYGCSPNEITVEGGLEKHP